MFYIHPTEQPLVEAAIRLGEWFLASADLDAGGREVVENVMEALRRLPAVTTGVSGSYGFRVIDDALNEWDYPSAEIPIGKEQLWNVSFCRVGASPNDPSSGEIWFEVTYCRFTYPQREHDELYDVSEELGFLRSSLDTLKGNYIGFAPSAFELARIYDWISHVDEVQTYKDRGPISRSKLVEPGP